MQIRGFVVCTMLAFVIVTALPRLGNCAAYSAHYGIDIENPVGAHVLASDSGTVVSVTPYKRGENQVTIRTGGGAECIYVYVKPLVAVGQVVMAGDVIGVMDTSAPTVRGMFHYGYRPEAGGMFVDPRKHLPPRALVE